ncbi:MAG: flagellar basal body P-ring formation chaperone FlgA [Deltaproteobacteria bacterium]|nr:flagellar basal body P-ring formation chaperone FlgA [Deltaproteobacteria bacterium]
MRALIKTFLSILVAVAGAAVLAPEQAPAADGSLEIHITGETTVRGDAVTLGQIASFEPAGDPRVASLKGMELASAPAPGNSYRFNRRFLDYKVGSAVADLGDEVTVKAPDSLVVHRTAQVVTSAHMEEIFRDHVLETAPWPENEIELESIRVPEDVALPEGALHWNIRGNGNAEYLGNVSATLTFYVDNRQIRRVPVSARVSITRDVVRAVRRIQRGDLIDRGDVMLVRETSMRRSGDALVDPEEAVGKRAARSIRSGNTLTAAMVENPPLVERGSSVIILAENDTLRITTRGEALEDGRRGERIRVRNLQSGKEFFTTVKAPGWVTVTF